MLREKRSVGNRKEMSKREGIGKKNSPFESFIKLIKLSDSKHSQIAIFVIVAIAIISLLVFLFIGREKITTIVTPLSPIDQIKKCMKESVQEGVDIVSVQGGSLNPENYYFYDGNKVEYLCYNEEYIEKCIMQKPLLKQSIERELEFFAEPKINNCVNSIKSSLQSKGYDVSSEKPEIFVELVPNNIIIGLVGIDLVISKDKTESYETIKTDLSSELYDLVMIASSILNWEARFGDSETMNYMIYYPSLKVEKKPQDEGTTIYILTHKDSLDKFLFASRSVVIPVGLTGE